MARKWIQMNKLLLKHVYAFLLRSSLKPRDMSSAFSWFVTENLTNQFFVGFVSYFIHNLTSGNCGMTSPLPCVLVTSQRLLNTSWNWKNVNARSRKGDRKRNFRSPLFISNNVKERNTILMFTKVYRGNIASDWLINCCTNAHCSCC